MTEGALLLAVYIVLLLTYIYIPFISIIATMFLVLPFLLYSAKHPLKYSIVFLIASTLISALVGTVFSIPVAIIFGTTGIVMGSCIQSKRSKATIFIASGVTFLIDLILGYIVAIQFFHFNFIKDSIKILRVSFDQSTEIMKALGHGSNDQILVKFNNAISMLQTLFPAELVVISFVTVWLLITINFPIAKRFRVDVPKWQPFHNMQLPKSVLWYYLITILISFLVHPKTGSYLFLALLNLGFIFQLLILLQGFSFIFYFGFIQKWPKAVLVLITVISFIISPILYIILLLGIIDLGMNLRKNFKRKP
jgi:uncharacterized protein YybS (DUF2232 family)